MKEFDPLFDFKGRALSLYRFSLPFNKPINFNGHHLTAREGLWLLEHLPDGSLLIGEICPLPGFSQETLAQSEQQILQLLQQPNQTQSSIDALLPSVSFALFCLQQKLPWKAAAINTKNQPVLSSTPLLQGAHSDVLKRYQALSCPNTIKLKVARSPVNEDVILLQRLTALNPNIRFRLDANQRWSTTEYKQFLIQIDRQSIDYIEEPTISLLDNLSISDHFQVKIGLDESLLTHIQVPQHPAVKTLVIKPMLIGSPTRLNALLLHAQQQQLEVNISASFESPIVINQLQYLSQQWQQQMQLPINQGLDTLQAFEQEMVKMAHDENRFKKILATQATCIWHS